MAIVDDIIKNGINNLGFPVAKDLITVPDLTPPWILAAGAWNDDGIWDDTDVWKDA